MIVSISQPLLLPPVIQQKHLPYSSLTKENYLQRSPTRGQKSYPGVLCNHKISCFPQTVFLPMLTSLYSALLIFQKTKTNFPSLVTMSLALHMPPNLQRNLHGCSGEWWNSTCVSMRYIPDGCRWFSWAQCNFFISSLLVVWSQRVVRPSYLFFLQWLERWSKLNHTCGWKF